MSFVVIKNLSLFAMTVLGVSVTVVAAVRVARKEDLLMPARATELDLAV